MDKNEIIIGCAEALGTSGEGIVKQDGMTVFVPYLLPGERAKIKILQVKGSIAYGRALEIFTPAEERVRPVCPVFGRCGGCRPASLQDGGRPRSAQKDRRDRDGRQPLRKEREGVFLPK